MTTLVKALSQRYPQSVYYTMRAFLLERREQPDRGGASAANADPNKLSKATVVRLPAGGTVRFLFYFFTLLLVSCVYSGFRVYPVWSWLFQV